jgi:hypothetical protein
VQQCVARDALNQAQNGAATPSSHNRICLPIANANALLDNGWSLIDVDAAWDDATPGQFAGPLIVFLATAAQMVEQGAAGMFVGPDELVDPLVADAGLLRACQPVADLLRAPFLAPKLVPNQRNHLVTQLARHKAGSATPGGCFVLRLLAAIATPPLIAPQLPAHHRLVAADLRRNRRLRQSHIMQRRKLRALLKRQMLAHSSPPNRRSSTASSGGRPSYPLCISELNPPKKRRSSFLSCGGR